MEWRIRGRGMLDRESAPVGKGKTSTYHGQMMLQRIPCAGIVRRRLCINPLTAHLLAPYCGAVGMSRYPARLAVMINSLSCLEALWSGR